MNPVSDRSDVEPAPTDGRSESESAWKVSDVDDPGDITESVRLVTALSQGARSQKPGTRNSGTGQYAIIPPNMFFAPGYSPRSSRATLAPLRAKPRAALVPAGPGADHDGVEAGRSRPVGSPEATGGSVTRRHRATP